MWETERISIQDDATVTDCAVKCKVTIKGNMRDAILRMSLIASTNSFILRYLAKGN